MNNTSFLSEEKAHNSHFNSLFCTGIAFVVKIKKTSTQEASADNFM